MYTLYYSPGAASLCVHWMLIELGVPFELKALDFERGDQKRAEYLALNRNGQVPTLVVDGRPITESCAILMLLAERHPEGGFSPSPNNAERAAYLELMVYLANALLPAFRNWFYVGDYADEPHQGDSLDHARQRIETVWTRLDERLADGRPFLLGDEVRGPDFVALMLARWSRNMPRPATDWPHLGAYVRRLRQRPGWIEVSTREALSEWV